MQEIANIIIPHWNTPELLKPCLESVKQYTPAGHLITVVDDGSFDQNKPFDLEKQGITCIYQDHKGFTAAINAGLQACEADHYVLLNSDIQVTEGWLDGLVAALDYDPKIGIVSASIRDAYNENWVIMGGCPHPPVHLSGWADRGECMDLRIDQDDYLAFACVLIRGECFKEMGLLDEQFKIYSSDTDYCYRARTAGWKLCYEPKVKVLHESGGTIRRHIGNAAFDAILRADQEALRAKWPGVWEKGLVIA